jgi:uncharacterized protein involved in exopolysaccharide biosynthesis
MSTAQPPGEPSHKALLAEVQALRQRVAALEQEKHDLEVILEMATDGSSGRGFLNYFF